MRPNANNEIVIPGSADLEDDAESNPFQCYHALPSFCRCLCMDSESIKLALCLLERIKAEKSAKAEKNDVNGIIRRIDYRLLKMEYTLNLICQSLNINRGE